MRTNPIVMMKFALTLILRAVIASQMVMIIWSSLIMPLKIRKKSDIKYWFTWKIQPIGLRRWKKSKPFSKNKNLMCLIITSKISSLLIVEVISWIKRRAFLYMRNIYRWMRRTKDEGSNRRLNVRKDRKRWRSCKNESQPRNKPRSKKQERRPFRLPRKNSTNTITYPPWRTPSKTANKNHLLPASSQKNQRANDNFFNYILINQYYY